MTRLRACRASSATDDAPEHSGDHPEMEMSGIDQEKECS